MRFDLDRLPTDPVLLHKMLRELAEVRDLEQAELKAAKATIKAQTLQIEKLEHRLSRLLRVQFGRSSEKMVVAQLRLMFDEVDLPAPANDDAPASNSFAPCPRLPHDGSKDCPTTALRLGQTFGANPGAVWGKTMRRVGAVYKSINFY